MRELDLQQLHDELLRLVVERTFDGSRITPVLDVVRADLQKVTAGGMPAVKRPLNWWWGSYPGLGSLIAE